MLNLYIKLYEGSKTYRNIIQEIETRKKQPITILDRKTAIEKYTAEGKLQYAEDTRKFQFPACWDDKLNAVIIMEPASLNPSELGTLIAFETTNGFQQEKFQKVTSNACAGHYRDQVTGLKEEEMIERAAKQYALDNEKIEQEGLGLQKSIISEAIQSNTITEEWAKRWGTKQLNCGEVWRLSCLSEYGQNHIEYYANYYKTTIAPNLKKESKNITKNNKIYHRLVLPIKTPAKKT